MGIVKINIDDKAIIANVGLEKVAERSTKNIDIYVPIEERTPIICKEDLKKMYPKCFEQKRKCFKNFEYEIKIDPTVKRLTQLGECRLSSKINSKQSMTR